MKFVIFFFLLPTLLFAANPPKSYVCLRAPSAILIDGKLEDAEWSSAPWTDAFVDIEGDLKPLPRFRTSVKMLWDNLYLYVAADLEEPQVWATISKRDSVIFHDNDFEMFLDPDGDSQEYGELEINALNTAWDLFLTKPYKDNGQALDAWNIDGLKSAVGVTGTLNHPADVDSGWTLEIALPWRGLEICMPHHRPPSAGEYWRINFSRVEWETQVQGNSYVKVPDKPESNWVWSPQGVVDMHRPEMWGVVIFARDTSYAPGLPADFYWDLRETAHAIYYAQREFLAKKNRWAKSLSELKLKLPKNQEAVVRKTSAGWNAVVSPIYEQQDAMMFPVAHIRDDGYFWFTSRRTETNGDSTSE